MFILAETSQSTSIKDLIVEILSEEWPLSLKSLHCKITRQQGVAVSFQATHKALSKLVEQNILAKENRTYCLNLDWVEQLIEFGAQTKEAYARVKKDTGMKTIEIRNQLSVEMCRERLRDGYNMESH